jgi:hypothetical protein
MTDSIIRDLGEGLIIRRSTAEDAKPLAQFNAEVHSEDEGDEKGLIDWTLDLLSGESPTFDVGDFTIVEDTRSGQIVSCACLISQTWSYEGLPFKVGRPELVGTHTDYRRRGLVREQFKILHEWSAARGEQVQAITGIPYYYRQFGYEMTLNLGGGRSGFEVHVPKLKEGDEEPYTFRKAVKEDVPFLIAAYNRGCRRSMVSAVWSKDLWHYELTKKRKNNLNRRKIFIIENQYCEAVGFIGIPAIKWREKSALTVYELAPGSSWSAITPSVIRFLWGTGLDLAKRHRLPQETFSFWLGKSHPAYEVIASKLPLISKPYAYYLRVPNLPDFIREISPALEIRLLESAFANYTGQVKLNFFRSGLNLDFKDGLLEDVQDLQPTELANANACFPALTFLQLLFGYRSMDELDHAFADCYAKDKENSLLLSALFPKKPSDVWEIS